MLRPIAFTLAVAVTLVANLPALAIAPGTDQLKTCQRFTANRYRVSLDEVNPKLGRRTSRGYYVDWRVPSYRASGYCFVTNNNQTSEFRVERGPRPGQGNSGNSGNLGPNERRYNNLPGYGNVIVNRVAGTAIGDKQYFTVRQLSNGRTGRWYARCANNRDQVYNETGRYVGNNPRLTVMFPYVCEISPLSRPSRPRPQPR